MDETEEHRAALEELLRQPAPYPGERFAGRGIVICAGGDTYFPCGWVAIGMLRRLGCTLPVELWYRGPREMTPETIALVEPLGVTCVDAYEVARRHPCRRLDSWEIKPFAIVHSRFAEVLYLDADNVALRDPAFLFDLPEYAAAGALFWPDRYVGPGTGFEWLKREAWKLCGLPYRLEPEIEAGQLVIDKRRCWKALAMTLHLNERSDYYYAFFYGDKDTFHLSWRRLGLDYALVPWRARDLGDSAAMIQHDLNGEPLFQHRNGDRWSVRRPPRPIAGFLREEECREVLAELARRWDGTVRSFPADFTASEARVYAGICAQRRFDYAIAGLGDRPLELLPDLRIGAGAQEMEVGWMIEDDKDGLPLLSIRNANGPTCFLRRGEDGVWRGRWRVYHRDRVELRPAPG
ncbi:MAG TPA: hypothetical protein VIE43_23075 [Thermoanaerobaculia bacterium]|nr:hypothetical protein [Thermoanaerobaculia bacterium]